MNISNFTESILNPNGRFRTLDGIYALKDAGGEPRMVITESTADFDVMFNDREFVLKVIMDPRADFARRVKDISVFTSNISSPHLVSCRYLDKELLVFDNMERYNYVDILLQERPDGIKLSDYLEEVCRNKNKAAILMVTGSLYRMGIWLLDNRFCHNQINTRNIYISSPDAVLVNYGRSLRSETSNDICELASLICAIYLTACEPDLYSIMLQEPLTSCNGLKLLIPKLYNILKDEKNDCLVDLLEELLVQNKDTSTICGLLEELTTASPRQYDSLKQMITDMDDVDKTTQTDHREVKKFQQIGDMHDMLLRAYDGKYWHYINRHGDSVISGEFIDAFDFREGRAVVETESGYGMIDLEGEYVLDPEFDDIEWDCENNVAMVTKEGMSGVYSRDGEPVTGLIYDQIVGQNDGFMIVRKGDHYGMIRRNGEIFLEVEYTDINGFDLHGVARTVKGNSVSYYDRDKELCNSIGDKLTGEVPA